MFKEFCDTCEAEDGTDYRDNDEGALCSDCYDKLSDNKKTEWHKS